MNDSSGINWKSQTAKANRPPIYSSTSSTLKPALSLSGRTTPQAPSKPGTPANDSFSNLVTFTGGAESKNLSIQEQQKRLADLKLGPGAGQTKEPDNHFGGGDDAFWNNLGSGRGTPVPPATRNDFTNGHTSIQAGAEEDDILADFSRSMAVSNNTPSTQQYAVQEDDDDPFGLAEFTAKAAATGQAQGPRNATAHNNDDDDVLGLLGRPASTVQRPQKAPTVVHSEEVHPQDRAVAELVEMGFPVEKARTALEATESGVDVQAAVGILLNQAHAEANRKPLTRGETRTGDPPLENRLEARRRGNGRSEPRSSRFVDNDPDDDDSVLAQRRQQRPEGRVEKDFEQRAAEIGTNFLKTANSLWKQSTKRVQQAVQELNSDSDSSQPKWMRDTTPEPRHHNPRGEAEVPRRRRRSSATATKQTATDEAKMLESARPTPPPRVTARSKAEPRFDSSQDSSRDHSPAIPSRLRESQAPARPATAREQPSHRSQPQSTNDRAALSRQAIDDQASQMYVSSARRREPAPEPPTHIADGDLLDGSFAASTPSTAQPFPSKATSAVSKASKPIPTAVRPPPPTRAIPPVSAIAMKAIQAALSAGKSAVELGDYSRAQQSYATALSHLPQTHPITIAVLTYRSSAALKTGDPKQAITDSDTTAKLIGGSKGDSETIDLLNNSPPQPMRDFYGKALMQKAEALENLERWSDATLAWREAVELGHGGATAIQGRTRCERHVNPPTPKAPPAVRKPLTTKASQKASAEAVSRLRAANMAAEKADDEKFRLGDSVEARIVAWKGGKADNLRALLSSLDAVLWPEAQWKKISMADLVLPGKVKVQYMKGIAKVHPDKIPTNATTEQRMIAGSVFSTLNEAWDKFKTENNL